MKQPKNLLHLLKPTRNTHKIAHKLMAIASGEINLQSKQDLTVYLSRSENQSCNVSAFHG